MTSDSSTSYTFDCQTCLIGGVYKLNIVHCKIRIKFLTKIILHINNSEIQHYNFIKSDFDKSRLRCMYSELKVSNYENHLYGVSLSVT